MHSFNRGFLPVAVILCVVLIAFAPGANGDRYISQTGSDSYDCTSPALPCQTLNKALSVLTSAGTIFVESDTYSGASNVGLTVNKAFSITIRGQGVTPATFNGGGTSFGIQTDGTGSLTLENLKFTNCLST